MAKVFDARAECPFEGQEILFDTNVWISIYGNDPGRERAVYSDFYGSALKKNNQIVTSDLVISELFNRLCKIEYELLFGKNDWRHLKDRRKNNDDYKERVESVRDTCLNVLEECKFLRSTWTPETLGASLEEAATGTLDMTDAALVGLCKEADLIFVSHDRDFESVDFTFVTAHPLVLKKVGL